MALEEVEQYRGISVETLEAAGVEWIEQDPTYPVRFPYRNLNGVWYERKGIRPGLDADGRPKLLSPPNSEPHLYNPLRIGPDSETVFFAEGEYDCLSVIDCGYAAVGSQGTNTFKAVWARLYSGAVCVIAFDGDTSGRQAAVKLRKLLRNQGGIAVIMDVPEGEDLNSLHQQGLLGVFIEEFMEQNEL